jgi:hypothetical protein
VPFAGQGAPEVCCLAESKLHAVYDVAIGSSVVGFVSRLFEGHARKQLARAIWRHNRELPR